MSIIDSVKRITQGLLESRQLATTMYGTVTKTVPLEVTVDQRLIIPADFLVVPEHLLKYEIDIEHTHSYSSGTTGSALSDKLVIRHGLEVGDKLILLRSDGGHIYVILGRLPQT